MATSRTDNAVVKNYVDAFRSAYPQKKLEIRTVKGGYRIVVDGDAGERTMDAADMGFATSAFKAHGRKPEAVSKYKLGSVARFV
jgi:hypothetical protein